MWLWFWLWSKNSRRRCEDWNDDYFFQKWTERGGIKIQMLRESMAMTYDYQQHNHPTSILIFCSNDLLKLTRNAHRLQILFFWFDEEIVYFQQEAFILPLELPIDLGTIGGSLHVAPWISYLIFTSNKYREINLWYDIVFVSEVIRNES